MPRETAIEKGRRYASEGRLTVMNVTGDTITASCRGDGRRYDLGHAPGRGWWCSCPARARCCHLYALGLVVDVAARGDGA